MKKQTKTKTPASQKEKDAALENALRLIAKNKAANLCVVPAGLYDGRELRAYDDRPGAMDFQALPSLQGGKRVFRGGCGVTRYSTGYGCYEITPVPGQPQIAHCHGFFVRHDRRGQGLGHWLKHDQNRELKCAGYDFATCTVDGENISQQKVLKKAGWHKLGEFQNSKTGGTTLIYGYNVNS